MTHKITEISATEDFTATLLASGYSQDVVEALTSFMSNEGAISQEVLIASRKLEIAETLSLHWLVTELRRRATDPKCDPGSAVEALKTLVDLSGRHRWLFKP